LAGRQALRTSVPLFFSSWEFWVSPCFVGWLVVARSIPLIILISDLTRIRHVVIIFDSDIPSFSICPFFFLRILLQCNTTPKPPKQTRLQIARYTLGKNSNLVSHPPSIPQSPLTQSLPHSVPASSPRTTLESPRLTINPRVKLIQQTGLVRSRRMRRRHTRSRTASTTSSGSSRRSRPHRAVSTSDRCPSSGSMATHHRPRRACRPGTDVPVPVGIDAWVERVGDPRRVRTVRPLCRFTCMSPSGSTAETGTGSHHPATGSHPRTPGDRARHGRRGLCPASRPHPGAGARAVEV